MAITITIPDEVIQNVQRLEYLIKNKEHSRNHEFRLQSTERLQNEVSEIVYAIMVEALIQNNLLITK